MRPPLESVPTPWHIGRTAGGRRTNAQIFDAGGREVAVSRRSDPRESNAIARLIIAAPALAAENARLRALLEEIGQTAQCRESNAWERKIKLEALVGLGEKARAALAGEDEREGRGTL